MFRLFGKSAGCALWIIISLIAVIVIVILVNVLLSVDYYAIKDEFSQIIDKLLQ